MPKKGDVKCRCCGRFVNTDTDGYWYATRGDLKDKPICDSCWYDDLAEPEAIVIFCEEGERQKVRVGSFSAEHEDGDEFDVNARDWGADYIRSLAWHRTDPWRGYFDGQTPQEWTRVISDWCGIDGYNLVGDLALFQKRWNDGDTPDFPAIVSFPRGSNVCSIIIDVMVPTDKVAAWQQWINAELDPSFEDKAESAEVR